MKTECTMMYRHLSVYSIIEYVDGSLGSRVLTGPSSELGTVMRNGGLGGSIHAVKCLTKIYT